MATHSSNSCPENSMDRGAWRATVQESDMTEETEHTRWYIWHPASLESSHKKGIWRDFLGVQWLRPCACIAGDTSLISGQETKISHDNQKKKERVYKETEKEQRLGNNSTMEDRRIEGYPKWSRERVPETQEGKKSDLWATHHHEEQ